MSRITFSHPQNQFFSTLSRNVDAYFRENKIKITGNKKLHSKAIFLISLLTVSYVALLTISPGWFSIMICILLGFNFAAIGFNVMHDGAHGSFSNKKWLNELAAYSLNLLGASSFLWKIKHNVVHHSFTNIEDIDDDIDIKPWMRVSKGQPKFWFHKFQHIYWVFLYGITYILWVFYLDFQKYFSRKIAVHEINKISKQEHLIFWASKMFYLGLFVALPISIVGWKFWLLGYLTTGFVTGLTISIVFQLAHVVEEVEFPIPNEANKIQSEWATHQIQTTADFATKNKFVSWYLGGLNFQVVHHLFPRISHIHYPKIQQIVKETCEQFQVPYFEFQTVGGAIKSHVKHLKNLRD